MLQVKNLDAYYGDIQVLGDINLTLEDGELVAVIGANGAGKSTLLKCISGILTPKRGTIFYNGDQINSISTRRIVEMGIIQVPEGRLLFPDMTVLENLELGAYRLKSKSEEAKKLEMVYDLFPILQERYKQFAGTLSGGEQQMLAIGRALMSSPKLLMLDEPSLGLSPLLVQTIFDLVLRINNELGISILLVEQNVKHSCDICSHAVVVENGSVVLEGLGCDLLNNEHVRRAYLGI